MSNEEKQFRHLGCYWATAESISMDGKIMRKLFRTGPQPTSILKNACAAGGCVVVDDDFFQSRLTWLTEHDFIEEFPSIRDSRKYRLTGSSQGVMTKGWAAAFDLVCKRHDEEVAEGVKMQTQRVRTQDWSK